MLKNGYYVIMIMVILWKSRKVLIYILVTVILGSLIYLIIARQDAKEPIIEEE